MQIHGHDFAALIGLDWADRKHDVCLLESGASKPEACVLDHDPAALGDWVEKLRSRFGGRPIAVCLELERGPIISALLEHDIFVIFPIRPSALANYRKTFKPSGAKDDPTTPFWRWTTYSATRNKLSRCGRNVHRCAPCSALSQIVDA